MKRVLIILNPCAGTKQANKYLVDIIDIFCRAGYETVVATTEKRGDGTEFARERCADFDLVVCIGGDGTFNEVIAGILESGKQVPIGYIPAGSTNDFAGSLNLSKNVVRAAEDIVRGCLLYTSHDHHGAVGGFARPVFHDAYCQLQMCISDSISIS